ncbi:MAG: sodium:proline symporter, partial [Spirulina sp. DLM2.Bin59]
FYTKVRPAGWGWRRQRERTGIPPGQDLGLDAQRVVAASFVLFGAMFSVGGFLLLRSLTGWVWLILGVLAWFWLQQLDKRAIPPMLRPGLVDQTDGPGEWGD